MRGLQRGQRCGSAHISRLVIHVFVAPVVHLQGRIIHAHILDAFLQLMEDVRPRCVQILVVHAIDDNEMAEDVVGNGSPPRESLPCFHRHLHLLFEKLEIVVGKVALRHVGVEEHQVFGHVAALVGGRLEVVHADFVTNLSRNVLTILKILPHGSPIIGLRESRRG